MFERLKNKYKSSKNMQILCIICAAILFFELVSHIGFFRNAITFIFNVLAPVITAAIIAYLLYPVVKFFERKVFKKLRYKKYLHGFCVIFTVALLVIFLILLVYLVINQLVDSIIHLINNLDDYVQSFISMLNDMMGEKANDISVFGINLPELEATSFESITGSIISWCTEHVSGILGGVSSVGSNVLNIGISIMLTIYILLDSEHLKKSFGRFSMSIVGPEKFVKYKKKCIRGSGIFIRYFGSNILDALIIGVCCYLFMIILKLPYALIIAAIVGVTNLVPTFGPIIGAIIGGILILLINPWGALWFIIYSIVSQFIDANILKPKLFGDTTGLRPMWVLAAIIIGGGLFGIVGMLLGVPVTAIVAITLNERVEKRIQKWDYMEY